MAEIMQRVCEVKLGGIKLKKEQEQAVIALLERQMFSLFCQLVLVCKMGLRGLHDSYGSWHFYICRFLFGLPTFLSLHSCYEGHFVLFCKEKIEPLDRVMANFKRVIGLRDFRCYLCVASLSLTPL